MDSQNLDESQASEQELGSDSGKSQAEENKVVADAGVNNTTEESKVDKLEEKAKAKIIETGKANAKAKEKNSVIYNIFTVVGIVLCVILIPILVMNCIMIAQSFINKDEVPGIGKFKPMIVLTDSMFPVIEAGDIIITEVATAEEVEVGDVISFYDPAGNGTSVVTHRVVEITTKDGQIAFVTKGDFNNTYDRELVPADKLIGIYKDVDDTPISDIKVGDLITFFNPIATDEQDVENSQNSEDADKSENNEDANDAATNVNVTEAPLGTLTDKEESADEEAAKDSEEEYEYIDNKEALTYKVVEIKGSGDDKVYVVEKEFTYSVYDKLEVKEDQIIGVYTELRRFDGIGKVAMFMQTTPGFIICVFVPIILLVGYDLIRRKIHDKGTKKDKEALLAELERLRAEKEKSQNDGE